ncbi:MAG: NAD(P)/FAD-dependent oxidoreductase [Chloroflexi bacterium]|nr:NAD(P)/FAD-dependent oxidoreductase [Chloroflexota bacterium]
MHMLYWLRDKLGFSARVYEAASDVGGTWYWNRYPGARCDSESIYYMFPDHVSEEILQEWTWSERYARQPEILRYLQFVSEKLDLRRDIQFDTRVASAVFDEDSNRWDITTERGERVVAKFLITAVGCLSTPFTPQFKGIESFEGSSFHTAEWPQGEVDFTRKRVAVIGTGATAVQLVPEIAEETAHLYVFQRTPSHDLPGRNHELDEDYIREVKATYKDIWKTAREAPAGFPFRLGTAAALEVTPEERQSAYEAAWERGSLAFFATFTDLAINREANDTANEFIRSKIRETVRDPEVAELLTPKYPLGTKRPPLEHGYYEAFNRDNVTLVDVQRAPIEEITPNGVRTTNADYNVDCIIYATGFDAMTGSLLKMDICGRGGLPLKEKWADGPITYLGLAAQGFPNMFMITGPQSPSVLCNMPMAIEQHVEWIAGCMSHMREEKLESIEALGDAEEGWMALHMRIADATMILQTDSWWVGANIPGKRRILYPFVGGLPTYRAKCDEVAAKGYEGFALSAQPVAAR